MTPMSRVAYPLFVIFGVAFIVRGIWGGIEGGFAGTSLLTSIVLLAAGALVLYRGIRGVRTMIAERRGSDSDSRGER